MWFSAQFGFAYAILLIIHCEHQGRYQWCSGHELFTCPRAAAYTWETRLGNWPQLFRHCNGSPHLLDSKCRCAISVIQGCSPLQHLSIFAEGVALFLKPTTPNLMFIHDALKILGMASCLYK
jgi:hypothetical protein